MDIGQIFSWIAANKFALIQGYLALMGFASIVVKLTPTLKDDTILKQIVSFTGKFIALNRK